MYRWYLHVSARHTLSTYVSSQAVRRLAVEIATYMSAACGCETSNGAWRQLVGFCKYRLSTSMK